VKNSGHIVGPNVKEGQRRVPDLICTDPYSKTVYIIDVRIAWTISTYGGGDGEYYTGKWATHDKSLYHWTTPSFHHYCTQRLGVSLV
jgi:hypothetical protein